MISNSEQNEIYDNYKIMKIKRSNIFNWITFYSEYLKLGQIKVRSLHLKIVITIYRSTARACPLANQLLTHEPVGNVAACCFRWSDDFNHLQNEKKTLLSFFFIFSLQWQRRSQRRPLNL